MLSRHIAFPAPPPFSHCLTLLATVFTNVSLRGGSKGTLIEDNTVSAVCLPPRLYKEKSAAIKQSYMSVLLYDEVFNTLIYSFCVYDYGTHTNAFHTDEGSFWVSCDISTMVSHTYKAHDMSLLTVFSLKRVVNTSQGRRLQRDIVWLFFPHGSLFPSLPSFKILIYYSVYPCQSKSYRDHH